MGISLKTRILLWGRSGNICAFPECECKIIQDATPDDEESLVADCCHIYADSDKGPRADVSMSQEDRDSYENIILLCKVHHKRVDDQRKTYTVPILQRMKNEHESNIERLVIGHKQDQQIKEMSVTIVEKIFELLDIDNYHSWTSSFLASGQPSVGVERYDSMRRALQFIFSRDHDLLTPNISNTLYSLQEILNDLLNYFDKEKVHFGNHYEIGKFYKGTTGWNENYDRDLRRFNSLVYIVEDYFLELTRCLNRLIQTVRQDLFIYFRFFEGMLTVESGLNSSVGFDVYKPLYKQGEHYDRKTFVEKDRFSRDIGFGHPGEVY